MILFENGYQFRLAACCPPPGKRLVPYVAVEMAGPSGEFVTVVGKVDTGASRTMLNADTAQALGMADMTSSARQATAVTATGQSFPYYPHRVLVRIGTNHTTPIDFPLQAGFAHEVKRNLFGIDWLIHLCLAMDAEAVHFLRD
ncbi:MAG: hypothetical protein R6V05_15150 [Candidatus Brocadiia bacterium]